MADAMIQRGEKLILSPTEEDFLLNDINDIAGFIHLFREKIPRIFFSFSRTNFKQTVNEYK